MKIILVVLGLVFSVSAFADRSQIRCEGTKFNVSENKLERVDLVPMAQDRNFWTNEIDDVAFSVDFLNYERDQVLTLFIMDKQKDFSSISREPFRADLGGLEMVSMKMVDGYIRGENINYEVRCFRN